MSVEVWFGVRGGTGVTTCVAQRAHDLGRCVAVDLDIARGDLAERFDLRPQASIASLASAAPGELDVSDIVAIGSMTGSVRVLASPAQPELVDFVDDGLVTDLIDLARQDGPVVVDAGCHFDVVVLAAFMSADRVVFVSRADAGCARQLGRLLDLCDRAGVRAELRLAVPGSPGSARDRFARAAGLVVMPTPRRLPPALRDVLSLLRATAGLTHPAVGAADVSL